MTLPTQLQQTLPHLIDHWVPVNPDIVTSIQKKLTVSSQTDILRDLRQDPSLLCWCLLGNDGYSSKAAADFTQRIASGAQKISGGTILPKSPHRLNQATPLQQRVLHKSLARTSASGVLAPYFEADGEMACTVSALAELGSSLIAWNYPNIFTRVMERAQRAGLAADQFQRQIDTWLGTMLGFTPHLLSLAIAQHCRMPDEICLGIGQSAEKLNPTPQSLTTGETLKKISTISDIYSRAALPGAGEYSLSRWETTRHELEADIGSSGLKKLLSSTDSVLRLYGRLMPQIHQPFIAGKAASTRESEKLPALFQKNLHIAHCTSELQNALRELYRRLEQNRNQNQIIELLISIVMEHGGFSRGAIYFVEGDSRILAPRYGIERDVGDWPRLSCNSAQDSEQPIVQAFLGKSPVIETHLTPATAAFCGPLGHTQRAGVLYLEHEQPEDSNNRLHPRAHFKAIQQALEDCLNLI